MLTRERLGVNLDFRLGNRLHARQLRNRRRGLLLERADLFVDDNALGKVVANTANDFAARSFQFVGEEFAIFSIRLNISV